MVQLLAAPGVGHDISFSLRAGVVSRAAVAATTAATSPAMIRLRCSPRTNPPDEASRAPKTATASAPPICRLVLKTALGVPPRGAGGGAGGGGGAGRIR